MTDTEPGTTAADPTLPARDHRACKSYWSANTMSVPVSGTEGYAEQAEELFKHYESLAALEVWGLLKRDDHQPHSPLRGSAEID
jgi:hypothetical protein